MLGIIIGIASVILMSSVGKSAERIIVGSVSSFGSDLVYIQSGGGGNLSSSILAFDKVKYKDYLAMKRGNFLENLTVILASDAVLVRNNVTTKTQVVGTTPEYSKTLNFYPEQGRFIEDYDVNGRTPILVLGNKVAADLFGDQDPIGQSLKIKNTAFKIVGVMEVQGGNAFEDYDTKVFMPVTSMQTYINGADYVNTIFGSAKGDMENTIDDLRIFMRQRHNIVNSQDDLSEDDFSVISQEQALGILNSVTGVLTFFLLGIIAISLVVGGIGIMNIMFVAVNQRTREIGLRKAVGATNRDIMLQFLIEAILVTFIGGIIGIILGASLAFLLSLVIRNFQATWEFSLTMESVLLSSIFSVLIGLIFGLIPARKASRLSPIEALRYE